MVLMLALFPSVLGISYGTIRGITTPAFKVEMRQHLMWNHTKVWTVETSRGTPLMIDVSTSSNWPINSKKEPSINLVVHTRGRLRPLIKRSRLKSCKSCQEYPTQTLEQTHLQPRCENHIILVGPLLGLCAATGSSWSWLQQFVHWD